MASLHAISPPHSFLPLSNHRKHISKTLPGSQILTCPKLFHNSILSRNKHKSDCFVVNSLVQDEFAVIPVQSEDFTDLQEGMAVSQVEREGNKSTTPVSGFGARDGQLSLEGFSSVSTSAVGGDGEGNQRENELEMERLIDRTINAMIVLAASSYAITKLLTIDHDYWHELFPFQDWWVVPVKVAFDQTAWSAVWNSIYFTVLGFLRLESPSTIFAELRSTFFPMLTAGWKLWPFAHVITYGMIPVEQRLLWVDCVELIWVTILST
ncbi:Protein SYM1 [Linum perenne]